MSVHERLDAGRATTEDALELFDSLEPANVNPALMGPSLRIPMPKSAMVGRIFQILMPFLTTSRSRARLRMTTYRGKSSATMIYDQLPMNDVFRKIDQDAVLGVMDLKGMKSPFFFILRREHGAINALKADGPDGPQP